MTLRALVEIGQPSPVEAARQGADARADGHLVVVEDDEEVLVQSAGIVQRLEDDPRRQGAVADDRNTVPLTFIGWGRGEGGLPLSRLHQQLIANLQAQGARDATAGM